MLNSQALSLVLKSLLTYLPKQYAITPSIVVLSVERSENEVGVKEGGEPIGETVE